VAIPEGSSSDAPVTNPGPSARRYWRQTGPLDARVVSTFNRRDPFAVRRDCFVAVVIAADYPLWRA
jgi:hypothetical protein